ncbi:hypothetical protein ACPUEN_00420 [Algoriphagus yeomjeoni]|uniref:hypothetical protein n=1 Tax=Algoriphagus yeomjeoni TaxID=291403 RepID=UPI003CE558D3
MRFIQSEVYPNLYLVKYPDKDYSVVEDVIKEKIKEHLKSEYKTGKPLSYTGEKAIYFYELGGMSFGFLGEAGTGYFIDHEQDLGGFVSEELGMYQDYRLAEFYYEPCSRDNSLVCGEINFFREGEHVKVDRLEDLYSIHLDTQNLSDSPKKTHKTGTIYYTISNQTLAIEKLKEAYKTKNETQFLEQFPADFQQFMTYFGWDSDSNQPNPLYEVSYEYIVYFFDLLSQDKHQKFESKLMGIAANGVWQEDGVNYFQNSAIEYIKRNNSYHLIDELPSKKAKSVLFFLFDGPHPQFDADFSSHLSPSKKEILEELFESAWYDDNENPGPIDYEEPKSYELADFENREHYFIRDIDFNQDNILDKIVSADPYQGDELYLFLKNREAYEFALKTINFSEDGGNQIVDIQPEQGGFVIKTAFPDQGILEAYHHISFEDNSWVLTHTVYRTQSSNQKNAFIYVCDVKQGLSLKESHFIEQLKGLPEEKERETLCTKEKIN